MNFPPAEELLARYCKIAEDALFEFLGQPSSTFKAPRIGDEFGPGGTVIGPKRLPRKLKKEHKKKGILLVTISIQPMNYIPDFRFDVVGLAEPVPNNGLIGS
jgi:hypothetical protein